MERLEKTNQEKRAISGIIDALTTLPFFLYQKQSTTLAIQVVQRLCNYVSSTIGKPGTEAVLKSLLLCMLDWLECFPECYIQLKDFVIKVVIETCSIKNIEEDAEYIKDYLLNKLGWGLPIINYTPFDGV